MRNPQDLLDSKAKKDAKLQEIVNTIQNSPNSMSDEDINNLDLIPWIKKALIGRKNIVLEFGGYQKLEDFLDAHTKIIYNEDFPGDIYRWTAGDMFVPFGRLSLLVRTDDLLFKTDKGVWCGSSFTKNIDLTNCTFVKSCKVLEYRSAVIELIGKRYPEVAKSSEKKPLFRIKKS